MSLCKTTVDVYLEGIYPFNVDFSVYFTLTHSHMIFTSSSNCCDVLYTNLLRGSATVYFKNGSAFEYTNVSRRAIANLMINPNMSLGFWINSNLINKVRTNELRVQFA